MQWNSPDNTYRKKTVMGLNAWGRIDYLKCNCPVLSTDAVG